MENEKSMSKVDKKSYEVLSAKSKERNSKFKLDNIEHLEEIRSQLRVTNFILIFTLLSLAYLFSYAYNTESELRSFISLESNIGKFAIALIVITLISFFASRNVIAFAVKVINKHFQDNA